MKAAASKQGGQRCKANTDVVGLSETRRTLKSSGTRLSIRLLASCRVHQRLGSRLSRVPDALDALLVWACETANVYNA
jgi:hypothetical protein